MPISEKTKLVEKNSSVFSIREQCELLQLNRSTLYYQPKPELSDSLSIWFCLEVLKKALAVGIPDIHNSDQGSQFTSDEYLSILKQYPTIRISMDHRGRAFDNIFNERLWRTIKYEEVYLKDYQSPNEAEQSEHMSIFTTMIGCINRLHTKHHRKSISQRR